MLYLLMRTLKLPIFSSLPFLPSPPTLASLQVYAEKYADDQAAFFADYAKSHKKLSELGAKFSPAEVRYRGAFRQCWR